MIKARSYPDFKEFIKGFVASVKAGDRYDFRTYQNAILPLTYSSPWPEADMAPLKSPEMFTYKPDYKVPYTEDMLYSVGAQMVTADFFMDLQYAIDQGKDVVTVYAEWLARVKPYSMLNAKLKDAIKPPVVTKQPTSQTVNEGATLTLSLEADNAIGYQWMKGEEELGNGSEATYVKDAVKPSDAGSYKCVVQGEADTSVESNAVTVNVNPLPVITKQPTSQTVKEGQAVSVSVEANHADSYQWLKDGVNVEGANKATFTKANAVVGDSGSYQCKAVGDDGETLSAAAKVTVNALQPPVFTKQPEAVTTKVGKAITLTAEASHATSYSWLKDGKAVEGANAATFTKASAVEADSGSYQCKAVGPDGTTLSNAAKVTVNPLELPAITAQPTDQTLTVGGKLTLTVTATGAKSYQWKKGGSNIEGANAATYTKDAVAAEDAGSYSVTVIGVDGNVDSKAVNVVVNPAAAEGGA
nr:MAG TPA: head outer capsid protein [Caudoviricetes sp.]